MSENSNRPLKVGLTLGVGHTNKREVHGWNELRAMAQHAEAVGFDSLWIPDHLIFDAGEVLGEPGNARSGMWECWSILAGLAAVTKRAELGTIVACTSFRNPALIAKMADTIDEISGGRVILGIGGGAAWAKEEYRAFGFPSAKLVDRFEEALQIIHPLLRKGAVDFRGKYYTATECELIPRGPRAGGPPILIGAHRHRMQHLAAQYADYWNGYALNTPESVAPMREAVDAACDKLGRNRTTLMRTTMLLVDLPESEEMPLWLQRIRHLSQAPVSGTAEQLAELLCSLAREGIDHVQLWAEPITMAGMMPLRPCWSS